MSRKTFILPGLESTVGRLKVMAVGVVLLHFGCNYYLGQFCKQGPTTLSLRVFSLLNDGSPLLLIGLSARYCSMYRMIAKKKTILPQLTYQTPTKTRLISYPTRLSSSPCCHPIKSFIFSWLDWITGDSEPLLQTDTQTCGPKLL